MKRWLAVALVGSALAFAGAATAAPPSDHAWVMSFFALGGGSSATTGQVRDAPRYGGITDGPLCCEATVSFERNFNADAMRGSIAGTLIVGGNANDTVWRGTFHGRVTPEGSDGVLIAVEEPTGRRFVGKWSIVGHPDQSVPHFLSIAVDGKLQD